MNLARLLYIRSTQKIITFVYTNNDHVENELKKKKHKTIWKTENCCSTTDPRKMKYLGISLTKDL